MPSMQPAPLWPLQVCHDHSSSHGVAVEASSMQLIRQQGGIVCHTASSVPGHGLNPHAASVLQIGRSLHALSCGLELRHHNTSPQLDARSDCSCMARPEHCVTAPCRHQRLTRIELRQLSPPTCLQPHVVLRSPLLPTLTAAWLQGLVGCLLGTCPHCWRMCQTWPSSLPHMRPCAPCTPACVLDALPLPRSATATLH